MLWSVCASAATKRCSTNRNREKKCIKKNLLSKTNFFFFVCAKNTPEWRREEASQLAARRAVSNALQHCNKLHFQDYYCSCCICHRLPRVSDGGWIWYLKHSPIFAPERSELIWWLMTERLTFTGWEFSHCFDFIELEDDMNTAHLPPGY